MTTADAKEQELLILAVNHTCACRSCKDAIAALIRGR